MIVCYLWCAEIQTLSCWMLGADVSTILIFPSLILVLKCDRLVGHDTRKIVLDGFPAKNIIASDIYHGKHLSQ
jgi:hypothetical protein